MIKERLATTAVAQDGLLAARDLTELRQLGAPIGALDDANLHNLADASRRTRVFVPWLYDFDYGWTPAREAADPRPGLQVPPYFLGAFPVRASGLEQAKHYFVTIDMRSFPKEARVFLVVPSAILPARVVKLIAGSRRPVEVGAFARVARDLGAFRLLTGKNLLSPLTRGKVVIEVESGQRAILNDLRLTTEQSVIEVYFGVARAHVKPKTYYRISFAQFIDHRLMGNFEHIFQAYHQYDIPVIGDKRTKLAYRRSSREVAAIPPLALAFFDNFQHALAAGYDFLPRSFGRPYTLDVISRDLAGDILKFFNQKGLTGKQIVKAVVDNPYIDATGALEAVPVRKKGIDSKTGDLIVSARRKLPKAKFASLAQIDTVAGVGPDTLSDIITSFLLARAQKGLAKVVAAKRPAQTQPWQPDPKLLATLRG